MIFPYVSVDEDVEVVFEVEQARGKRGSDKANDQRPRYRRIGKGHVEDVDLRLGGA